MDELQDRIEIRSLLARYTRGLDRRDRALVASCYHSDSRHDHGRFRGTGAQFGEWAIGTILSEFPWSMHTLQQSLIEFQTRDRASVETYAIACHRGSGEPGGWADEDVWIRYCDVVERREGGPWLIANRTIAYEWSRVDQVDETLPTSSRDPLGHHTDEDPIYQILGVQR